MPVLRILICYNRMKKKIAKNVMEHLLLTILSNRKTPTAQQHIAFEPSTNAMNISSPILCQAAALTHHTFYYF